MQRLHANQYFTPQRNFYCLISRLSPLSSANYHCHEFFELEIVTSGIATDTINGIPYSLHRGDFFFLRPDDTHCISSIDETNSTLVNLAVSVSMMEEILSFLEVTDISTLPWPLKGHLPPELIPQLSHQARQLAFPSKDALKERSLIKQWFTTCFLHCPSLHDSSQKKQLPAWLHQLLQELQTPEGLVGGLSYIKSHTTLSYPHICRYFQKYLQQTPVEWINEHRLLYSANLLLHTDSSILNISMECGFNNLSHFNHLFKAFFGLSPSAFRTIF